MVDVANCFVVSVICLQALYNCCLSVVGQYIYKFFLESYPNDGPRNGTNISSLVIDPYGSDVSTCAKNSTNTSSSAAELWAQQRSADLIFQMTLWRAFPVIVVTYFFGLYASRLNRPVILFVSLLGNAIHVVIYQAIIYEHLPEYWWYISAFTAGLAGGTNVLGIVLNLIITEGTGEHERSSRFVGIGAVSTALSAAVTFGIGYYIQWRGFTDLFWMAIGLEALSMVAVLFTPKPVRPTMPTAATTIDETTSLLSATRPDVHITAPPPTHRCYGFFDMCLLFSFKHGSPKKTISLILIIASYVFHLLAVSSTAPILWYLLGAPFCWTSTDLGNFSAVSLISTAIFSVLGMKALSSCGANDALICAIGHVSFLAYSLWIAFSEHTWQLYLALLINPFSGYQSALTVSMLSKFLEVHERSNVFTLVTEINTIIVAFGTSFFNWVYARTVTHQRNCTLLIASGLCVIPCILNIYLYVISRKTPDEQEASATSEVDTSPTPSLLSNNILPPDADVTGSLLASFSLTNNLCLSQNERPRSESYSSINEQHVVT